MVDELFNLYEEINRIYIRLSKMDIDGKNNSKDYLTLIEKLKEKTIYEKVLINKFYLNNKKEFENFAISSQDCVGDVYDRFNNYLDLYCKYDLCVDDIDRKIEEVYNTCTRNIFLVYLSFLQENMELSLENKSKLLWYKYQKAFINHQIEKCLIDNNFNISKINYVDSYWVGDLSGLAQGIVDTVIRDCYNDMINLIVMELMLIEDSNYEKDYEKFRSINSQCMLKACLALINSGDYEEIKNNINSKMELFFNGKNTISLGIIMSILKERMEYRTRVRFISKRPLSL